MNIFERQKDYLRLLQRIEGTTRRIRVQRPTNNNFEIAGNPWIPFSEDVWSTSPLITCSVLKNEIALDPDIKEWSVLKSEMDKVLSTINKMSIPYLLSWTGGKGIHVEIFFDISKITIPDDVVIGIAKYEIDIGTAVRTLLKDWIFKEAGVKPESVTLDDSKIKWSNKRKGSMIRIFGTLRPDGGTKTLISSIPDTRPEPHSLPLVFPDEIQLWDVTFLGKEIINELKSEITKIEEAIEEENPFVSWMQARVEQARAEGRLPKEKNKLCKGLKNALNGRITEGHRDAVATGIVNAMRFWKKESKLKTAELIRKWCTTCTPPIDFRGRKIDIKIDMIYQKKEMEHSPCTFFIPADLCSNSQCDVLKRPDKHRIKQGAEA